MSKRKSIKKKPKETREVWVRVKGCRGVKPPRITFKLGDADPGDSFTHYIWVKAEPPKRGGQLEVLRVAVECPDAEAGAKKADRAYDLKIDRLELLEALLDSSWPDM